MGRRLILDTCILIAYERGSINSASLDDDKLAVAAITVAEYRVGIELADSQERASKRIRALEVITSVVEVLDYTDVTALHHARLMAHTRREGKPRGAHDIIIAAHAAETGRTILSNDANARFASLPGITVVEP